MVIFLQINLLFLFGRKRFNKLFRHSFTLHRLFYMAENGQIKTIPNFIWPTNIDSLLLYDPLYDSFSSGGTVRVNQITSDAPRCLSGSILLALDMN